MPFRNIHNKFILFIIGINFLLNFSCDNTTDSKSDFIFPLQIGNYWIHQRSVLITSIVPDTATLDTSSEYNSLIEGEITRKVTLSNGAEGLEYFSVESDSLYNYTSFDFYAARTDGLYLLGYSGAGGMAQPKTSDRYHVEFKGRSFSSLKDLVDIIKGSISNPLQKQDSIYLENPQPLVLKYPLKTGSSWTFRTAGNHWRIDKEISVMENTTTPAGTFNCYVIQWKYDMDADGTWDDDIRLTDYISKEGLVKRHIEIDNIPFFTEDGTLIRTDDYLEESVLIEFGQRQDTGF